MKNYLLQIALTVLSYLVPKKKNLLILGAGDAKQFQGNPKYLYLFLAQNQSSIEFYWSAKSGEQRKKLAARNLPYINPYSKNGFIKLLRAKYIVIEKSSYDAYYTPMILGNFNFIQTWHGSPFKKVGIHAAEHLQGSIHMSSNPENLMYKILKSINFFSRQKYKLITSPSQYVSEIFESAFENKNVKITGYPRNDVFFNKKLAFNDYTELLKRKEYQKIILYAPTFRDNKDSVSAFSDQLKEYNNSLAELGYLLVVKKHPWEKQLVIPEGLSNIVDISEDVDDIQEVLIHIDILITDYSSTFYDYMLTGNPTIFYAYDLEEYLENCRGLYFDYKEGLQGPFAFSEEALFKLIFTSDEWTRDKAYQEKYKTVLDRFNEYKDGDSSQRLLKYLWGEDFQVN